MQLAPEWKRVLRRAWSIRLIGLAGLLTTADGILQAFGTHSLTLTIITAIVDGAAFMARLIAQKEV